MGDLEVFLGDARVDHAVLELRPDYRALLLAVDGIVPGSSDGQGEELLAAAEASVRGLHGPVDELPHIAAWREAYRAFGAKPQRTRNSLEALTRRALSDVGLPRVNRLTDIYNTVSVLHQVPVGGEDLSRYVGPPRLVRATGDEPFDTVADGAVVIEHPEVGEVVWCDESGVTCRRWNWRQGRRTQLHDDTTRALFILDALEPMDDDALDAAADDLLAHVSRLGPDLRTARRLIAAGG